MNNMKVVCRCNCNCNYITIGKTYDIIYEGDQYLIIDDNGIRGYYPKEYFKPLSEIRNEKIERLLDE